MISPGKISQLFINNFIICFAAAKSLQSENEHETNEWLFRTVWVQCQKNPWIKLGAVVTGFSTLNH